MTSEEQEMPLAKIVTWTIEPKSSDVRRASQAALSAIFSMNGPHFTGILQKLPKAYQVCTYLWFPDEIESESVIGEFRLQESVTDVLARTLMSQSSTNESPTSRSIAASTTTTDGPGPFPMKPRSLQSPNSVSVGSLPRKSPFRTLPIDPVDDSENLNPDDIQQSLRTTANAIQVNNSFK